MFRPIHLDPSQSSSEKFHFSIDTSSQWRDAQFTLFFLSFRIIQTTQEIEMAEISKIDARQLKTKFQ